MYTYLHSLDFNSILSENYRLEFLQQGLGWRCYALRWKKLWFFPLGWSLERRRMRQIPPKNAILSISQLTTFQSCQFQFCHRSFRWEVFCQWKLFLFSFDQSILHPSEGNCRATAPLVKPFIPAQWIEMASSHHQMLI